MPIALSYPGVYVEEIPSGVHTIVGVATSITAFVGRTLSGPVGEPTTVFGAGDFDRIFGGPAVGFSLPRAVHDFFQNGGGQAIIVRLYQADAHPERASVRFVVGKLKFVAASPGTWAQSLRVSATTTAGSKIFDLTIRDTRPGGRTELLKAVSIDPNSRRRLDKVLQSESNFLLLDGDLPTDAGFGTDTTITDAATKADQALDAKLRALSAKAGAGGIASLGQAAAVKAVAAAKQADDDAAAAVTAASTAQTNATTAQTNAAADQKAKAATQAQAVKDLDAAKTTAEGTAKALAAAILLQKQDQDAFDAATALGDAVKIAAAKKTLDDDIGDTAKKRKDDDDAQGAVITKQAAKKKADDELAVANSIQSGANLQKAEADAAVTKAATVKAATASVLTTANDTKTNADTAATGAGTNLTGAQNDYDAARDKLASIFQKWGGSDGADLTYAATFAPGSAQADKTGLYALERVDLFNLLCIPPYAQDGSGGPQPVEVGLLAEAATYCVKRRAMLLVDPPGRWTSPEQALAEFPDTYPGIIGPDARNSATFFPLLLAPDPLNGNQVESFVPCGAMAGIFARTDVARGIWKAPAGQDATLSGFLGPAVKLSDDGQGELNPLGLNCIRLFPIIGTVAWGSRTNRGSDVLADDYKYIPVRRTALYIEESLFRGLKWVVFEPNDEPLWAQIRLNVGSFMQDLFRQGAFQGRTPAEAYLVKCDGETTTQDDIDRGVVNILVGFAPLKPAEFVVLQIQQLTGQSQA